MIEYIEISLACYPFNDLLKTNRVSSIISKASFRVRVKVRYRGVMKEGTHKDSALVPH